MHTKLITVVAAATMALSCNQKKNESTLNAADDLIYEIEEVETPASVIEQIKAEQAARMSQPKDEDFGATLVIIGNIVNLGKEVWNIIKENKPVSNVKNDYANALPQGVKSEEDLQGFSDLIHTSFRISAKSALGWKMYDLTYTTVHQFGGNYDGKGKYLATVSIIPSNVEIGYNRKLDFSTTKVSVTNVGTKEAPIASLTMEMKLSVDGTFKKVEKQKVFQFRGDSKKVIQSQ